MELSTSDFDKEKLQERLAKLSGGVGVIKVGAATETEAKEITDRVKDAVEATKAAIEEGIVPGGGVALIRVLKVLDSITDGTKDVLTGVNMLRIALEAPLKQIAKNAGQNGDVVIEKVKANNSVNFGYNAGADNYEDLVLAGIIDPTKVTRTALQNAASIAVMILTTESAVTDLPKKDDDKPAMPQMPGGMGMY